MDFQFIFFPISVFFVRVQIAESRLPDGDPNDSQELYFRN